MHSIEISFLTMQICLPISMSGYKKSDFEAAIDKLAPLVKVGGIKRGGTYWMHSSLYNTVRSDQ